MTFLVPITLYGWIAVAIWLFTVMPPRRAVLAAYMIAWLFLPQASIPLSGLPDLDKITCTSMGALLGVFLFDAGKITALRPSWVDIPMFVWCLLSLPSSITNGLGWYDGISGVLRDIFVWGIPYLIGRLYFNDLEGLRDLAVGIFIGGMVYVPLCAWEIRMSPSLHAMVYGFHPASFAMTIRFGGYRPTVFMQHGLAVGMWMTSASLVGLWLWHTGALTRYRNMPMNLLVPVLVTITVMCKSTGAIVLLIVGVAILFINKYLRSGLLMLLVLCLAPVYMYVRSQGLWDAHQLVDISAMISDERASSLTDRLFNEDLLTEKAMQKPVWGWGAWGRWRVSDELGRDITVSDGMWIIVRGEKGLVGLTTVTLVILLPLLVLLIRVPARQWAEPMMAAPATLAMLLLIYSMDNLFNGMLNPIFLLGAGGLSGLYVNFPRLKAKARQAQIIANQMRMQMQMQLQAQRFPPQASPQRPAPHG